MALARFKITDWLAGHLKAFGSNSGYIMAVTLVDDTGAAGGAVTGTVAIDQTTPGTTNRVVAAGTAAHGAAASGNPVLSGGVFDNAYGTLDTGDVGKLRLSASGRQVVGIGGVYVGADAYNNAALFAYAADDDVPTAARPAITAGLVYNGTTWDRMRGDTTGLTVHNKAATGTKSSVNSGVGSVTLLALNTARKGATITNTDANALYVDLSGGTASATSYSAKLITDAYLEVPFGYTGLITGIWAADGAGVALMTEFT